MEMACEVESAEVSKRGPGIYSATGCDMLLERLLARWYAGDLATSHLAGHPMLERQLVCRYLWTLMAAQMTMTEQWVCALRL